MDMFCYLRKETKDKSGKGRQEEKKRDFKPQTITHTFLTDKCFAVGLRLEKRAMLKCRLHGTAHIHSERTINGIGNFHKIIITTGLGEHKLQTSMQTKPDGNHRPSRRI